MEAAKASRAARELASQVLAYRSVADPSAWFTLWPFHDDVAADKRHDGPAGDIPALVNGPGRYRVKHIARDLNPALQIDDHQIRIGTDRNRPFFRIEAEDTRWIFTRDLRQALDGDPSFVHAFAQHQGKHSFDARRKAADRRPDVTRLHRLPASCMGDMIAADAIDRAGGKRVPERRVCGAIAQRHIDLPGILVQHQVMSADFTIDF